MLGKLSARISIIFLGILIFAFPVVTSAATFRNDANVAQTETVSGNLYVTGSAPVIAGIIEGDLVSSGGTVVASGTVGGDGLIAGGNVNVTGNIKGDLRVFGGNVYFDGQTGGELMAAGGNVRIGPNAVIGSDLIIYGGKTEIDPAAKITGRKSVWSGEETANDGKNITRVTEFLQTAFLVSQLITILGLLLIAAIFFGFFPTVTNAIAVKALDKSAIWKNLGLGFLMFLVMPIAAVLCLISGIGAMLGLILIFAFIIYLLVSAVLAGVVFGGWLYKVTKRPKKFQMKWLPLIFGVILLHIISLIPFIGWIVAYVFLLLTWGACMRVKWDLIKSIK